MKFSVRESISTEQAAAEAQEWTWIDAPAATKPIPSRAITLKVSAAKLRLLDKEDLMSAARKKTGFDAAKLEEKYR